MNVHPYRLPAARCLFVLLLATCPLAAKADPIREMQEQAQSQGYADWGHWGFSPEKYSSWISHSNRLIPVYTFGATLESVQGANSVYRDPKKIESLYGRLPSGTHNPNASYFDQTDVHRLQRDAFAAGKKYIFLIVFDGMDWDTTRAAAIYHARDVIYEDGRGTGLYFQAYRGATTDFGYVVTSPYCGKAVVDVDAQLVIESKLPPFGGYDPRYGGQTPWSKNVDLTYLAGRNREQPHAYTDSSSSATSLTCGIKTYNAGVNVDVDGNHVVPIARELQEHGYRVGVVTSVPVPHATPAAAYANNVTRADYQDLTRDLLGVRSSAHRAAPLPGVDVLLGAGWGENAMEDKGQGQNFVPGNRYVAEGTIEAIDVAHGGRYRVVQRTGGINGRENLMAATREAAANDERLFGLFGARGGNLPYHTADGQFDPYEPPAASTGGDSSAGAVQRNAPAYTPADIAENPTLADFTSAALHVLGRDEKPFWMMIEAGDVDWSNHKNNIDNAIGAVKCGDDAFRVVVEWIETRKAWNESVVILTADHGHLFVLKDPMALTRRGRGAK